MTNRTESDRLDARILGILQRDGRRPYAELGADVGISGPSAHERVKKLEARGVIRAYRADVDPAALGYGVLAFVWLDQAPGKAVTDLTEHFEAIPEVEECHHIAGDADYLLKLRARDTRHLEGIIGRLQAIPDVFTTETSVVFSSAFERRVPPAADLAGTGDAASRETGTGTGS